MPATRRQFLTYMSLGAGGVVLAPIWRQLEAHAVAAGQPNPRFLFVVEGNGLPWEQIQPVGIERGGRTEFRGGVAVVLRPEARDRLIDRSHEGHALPRALEPLNPWKNRVTILQGLSGRVAGGGHSTNFGAL